MNPDPWAAPAEPTPAFPKLKLPATTCNPECVRCGHPEDAGVCETCVLVCDHPQQPETRPSAKTGRSVRAARRVANLCLIRTRAAAEVAPGAGDCPNLILVRDCPFCRHAHIHTGNPDASPYRIAPCGKRRRPYILDLPAGRNGDHR